MMRQRIRFMIKSGIFLLILLVTLLILTWVFLPKTFFSSLWPNMSTTVNFYGMEKNSIDVLFLGSSQCVSAFNPQEIYDQYGLRSYNLGTQEQSLLVSYYWLKEALRYQHPRAIVLDVFMCFPYPYNPPLNSPEGAVRYAMDPMRWSSVKIEAIDAICEHDGAQTKISYYFPLNRFHGRWTSLNEDDFCFIERLSHGEMKGFSVLKDRCGNESYQPFDTDDSVEPERMVPLMQEYLDKITALCKENNIELILVKTPTLDFNVARYNCVNAYAQEHQLAYYDFNESSLYHEVNYQFSADNNDVWHINYLGAKKVSDKIGEILAGEGYRIPAVYDEQWEESRYFYETTVQNAELSTITDIEEYLQAINRSAYSIFIAVKDEASTSINDSIAQRLQQLGLSTDLRDKFGHSYYAIITPDGVSENCGVQMLSVSGPFCNGQCVYKISSAGFESGSSCSILINNVEYAKMGRGLNIVVYDNIYRRVVDSVCFDTYDPTLNATR